MRKREDGDARTLRAAHQFLARHDQLRGITDTGAYKKLGALLDSIDRRATAQVSEAMAGEAATQTALSLRQELIDDHMKPIASIARWLETEHPALQALRMPDSYRTAKALIAHAEAMGAEASMNKALFVDAGLPDDFVERMQGAIERFNAATLQPTQHRVARRGATEGARAELDRAKNYLKVIDSFVIKVVHDKPALLAEWRAVKQFPPRKKARAEEAKVLDAPPEPLMLPASADPIALTARVEEAEPAERPARWTLRGLFRT